MQMALATHNIDKDDIKMILTPDKCVKKKVCFILSIYFCDDEKSIDFVRVLHTGNSRTLADLQLDAQNNYLFTYNTFIKILYMFRA
jgi:hypothetical protein